MQMHGVCRCIKILLLSKARNFKTYFHQISSKQQSLTQIPNWVTGTKKKKKGIT